MNQSVNRAARGILVPLLLTSVIASLVVLGVIVAADTAAHATARGYTSSMNASANVRVGPGICARTWQHPHGEHARACRAKGWVIQRHLIINRNGNVWTDVPRCAVEDGHWCYWNARTMGNHRGRSFVQLGRKGTFYSLASINGRRTEGRS